MQFQADTVIQDLKGEQRWQVIKPLERLPYLRRWQVKDRAPGMERDLDLLTLDYTELPVKDRDFAIQSLRDDFMRVARILGKGGYNFLPEPIDLITLNNHQDPMDADLRTTEIGLLHAQMKGFNLLPIGNDNNGQLNVHHLRNIVLSTLKTMRVLHENRVVMQAFARSRIVINRVTYKPYFKGIQTLMFMADFNGYNSNRTSLSPSKEFAAPECFDPDGRLTPATDIYALGKLAMQLLLDQHYGKHFTPLNPFPADVQNVINALNLPAPWPRFLSICLQPDPTQRFQNTFEAEIFLLPNAKREVAEKVAKEKAEARQQTTAKTKQTTQSSSAAAKDFKTTQKYSWSYRENHQLPDAMLLIWNDRLTTREEIFNFRVLYSDLSLNHNLKPRLFFQTYSQGSVAKNTFFSMLQRQYRLKVIALDGQQNPIVVLNHRLDPYLSNIRHLILVGNPDEAGVQSMLQHPNASKWRIHWVRGAGNWNPSIAVDRVTDAAKYIQAKNR